MDHGVETKAALKRLVKHIGSMAGRLRLSRREGSRILTYHSIGQRDHEMNVPPDAFREQMEWLAANRRILPLSAAAAGEPGVAVTFDDGYRDVLTNAAPVLAELVIPATVFVTAGRMGGMLDHDRDPRTSALLSWSELRSLERMGVGVGSHTLTHARLASLSEEGQREQITGSKWMIEDALGHPIEAFAYPYGTMNDFDHVSRRIVRESGFRYAVSNAYGPNPADSDHWALRRIGIDRTDDVSLFQAKVEGTLDLLRLLDTTPGIHARRLLNRLLKVG